jgi:hypothetical protein
MGLCGKWPAFSITIIREEGAQEAFGPAGQVHPDAAVGRPVQVEGGLRRPLARTVAGRTAAAMAPQLWMRLLPGSYMGRRDTAAG